MREVQEGHLPSLRCTPPLILSLKTSPLSSETSSQFTHSRYSTAFIRRRPSKELERIGRLSMPRATDLVLTYIETIQFSKFAIQCISTALEP